MVWNGMIWYGIVDFCKADYMRWKQVWSSVSASGLDTAKGRIGQYVLKNIFSTIRGIAASTAHKQATCTKQHIFAIRVR